jgi:hypothetical protein
MTAPLAIKKTEMASILKAGAEAGYAQIRVKIDIASGIIDATFIKEAANHGGRYDGDEWDDA